MNRRKFIRNAGLVAGASFAAPYILPSGRLFAQTGNQIAPHVLFVMFGGGIRIQESIGQSYLLDAQPQADGTNPGNIMYNMLEGAPPSQKIVYGDDGILPGDSPYPKILSQTIQRQGTTFRELRATGGGHYGAYTAMIQGRSEKTLGLRQRPIYPTIFEYVRRHLGAPASKVWFIGENIGNSIPLLNYSTSANYGTKYGANFYAPPVTFGTPGYNSYFGGEIYHPEEEMKYVYKMKYFMDNYYRNLGRVLEKIGNTEDEKYQIKKFMERQYINSSSADIIQCTLQVMEEFKPSLTVINFNAGVDACHANFTNYLKAIHLNDNNIGKLWSGVQNIPGLAGNTAMILCPDMGRNTVGSGVLDQNNFKAFDHDGSDPNIYRIFSQLVGPGIPQNHLVGDENNPKGTQTDMVMTIGELLGIKSDIQSAGFISNTQSLFEQW